MGSFNVYMYMHTRWDNEPTCALGAPASLPAIRKTIQAADESPNAGKMPALPGFMERNRRMRAQAACHARTTSHTVMGRN